MTPFQKKTLLRTLLIGILRMWFCVGMTYIGWAPAITGFLTSLCIAFRTGWRQEGIGLLAIIGCGMTLLSFLFSSIPVYTSRPSLDLFTIDQIPTIGCLPGLSGSISIDKKVISLPSLCSRTPLPIIAGQRVSIPSATPFVMNLGNGVSFFSPGDTTVVTKRFDSGYSAQIIDGTGSIYPAPNALPQHPLQSEIYERYTRDRIAYLQKHYARVREHAPGLTRVALRKMQLLGIINRSYRDSASNLRWYLQETQK